MAHESKDALLEWVHYNREGLKDHRLYAIGTTGALLEENLDLEISKLMSGNWGTVTGHSGHDRPALTDASLHLENSRPSIKIY